MPVAPARRAAYQVVLRVFEDGAYADRALVPAAAGLDARDRALAQRIAYGTVQRIRTLDHGIEALGRRPVHKLDAPVRAALRIGAYQLGYLDSVPAHAAVGESVELVREAGLERGVAFTNAVLRRLSEGLRGLLASLPEGTAEEAALKHSYPDWVAETWWRELGADDALALMQAQNEAPETVVRLNRRKEGHVDGRPDPDLPDALHVDRVDERALAEGLIWPQSRGSQLAGLAVGSVEGERVLDLCAAPGGKATQLAGEVVAVEKHPGRARELEENCRRLGADNVTVVCADALELPPGLTGFDRVLVDAPCSGLGVLASRPDLRWRSQPLPELQLALLRAAAERVRPGGTVTYSVCTINAAENEEVVDTSGLEPEPVGDEWPQFRHPGRPEFLLTLPHVHRTSGFFIARLRSSA
ncbi:MAG TPA: transcription antitermination factor NusB [Gaiellaceae bacterium]